MADLAGFNAGEVEPNVAIAPVPADTYECIIVASEKKATTAGDGEYLKLELQITRGQFQNRKLWDNLNIRNKNATAQQIALGTLSAICRAVGVLTPKDSIELHNKPLMVKVVVKTDAEYGPKNVVKGYSARVIGAPVQAQPAEANGSAPQPVAAGAAGGKPW